MPAKAALRCDELLDEIERVALTAPHPNIRNPRYFADMLGGTVSTNDEMMEIFLEEVLAAMVRIVGRQWEYVATA